MRDTFREREVKVFWSIHHARDRFQDSLRCVSIFAWATEARIKSIQSSSIWVLRRLSLPEAYGSNPSIRCDGTGFPSTVWSSTRNTKQFICEQFLCEFNLEQSLYVRTSALAVDFTLRKLICDWWVSQISDMYSIFELHRSRIPSCSPVCGRAGLRSNQLRFAGAIT